VSAVVERFAAWRATQDAMYLRRRAALGAHPPGPWAAVYDLITPRAQGILLAALVPSVAPPSPQPAPVPLLLPCWVRAEHLVPGTAVWSAVVEQPLRRQGGWTLAADRVLVRWLGLLDAREPKDRAVTALAAALRTWGNREWVRQTPWPAQLLVAQRVRHLTALLSPAARAAPGLFAAFVAGTDTYLHATIPSTRYLGLLTAQALARHWKPHGSDASAPLDFGVAGSPGYMALPAAVRADLDHVAAVDDDALGPVADAYVDDDDDNKNSTYRGDDPMSGRPETAPAAAAQAAAAREMHVPDGASVAPVTGLDVDVDEDLVPYAMPDEAQRSSGAARAPDSKYDNKEDDVMPTRRKEPRPLAYRDGPTTERKRERERERGAHTHTHTHTPPLMLRQTGVGM
jgi:hypothetical protein